MTDDATPRVGYRLGFLSLHCWLDEDGTHVWQHHDCDGVAVVSMLPTPWKADIHGHVTPSIQCDGCGLHAFGIIEARP